MRFAYPLGGAVQLSCPPRMGSERAQRPSTSEFLDHESLNLARKTCDCGLEAFASDTNIDDEPAPIRAAGLKFGGTHVTNLNWWLL